MDGVQKARRVYPWQWAKLWFQYAIPTRYQTMFDRDFAAESKRTTAAAWKNREFLEENPLDLDRLRNPESTDSMLVVLPEDLEREEGRVEVKETLARKERVVLFKAFFKGETELLKWGREPAKHFANKPYVFNVSQDDPQANAATGLLELDLLPALEKMAAMERVYLGFSVTLAEDNPAFRGHLERILFKLADLMPPGPDIRRYFTHSFLYHGNQYQALLHQATTPDFTFQIANSKYWRFVMRKWSPIMRSIPATGIPGVILSRHDLIHKTDIPFQEVLAEPGDILFFPEHTWHEVHNIEDGPGLMCGLRSQYPTRKIFNELLRPKGMSPSLAWHKFSSLIPLKFHAANQDRPEFKVD